jgi:hypothetical protein
MSPRPEWKRPKPHARYNWVRGKWTADYGHRLLRACSKCGGPAFSLKPSIVCNECQRRVGAEQRALQREALLRLGLITPKGRKPAANYQQAQRRAISLVSAAKASRKLPRLDGTIICVDCKRKPAAMYDHRDYAKPLAVDPVCHYCNVRRGPALWSVTPLIEQGGS